MKETYLSKSRNVTYIRRWMPYFVIAAVLINIGFLSFAVDVIILLTASLSNILGLETQSANPLSLEVSRKYGNIALLIMFVIVSIRGLQKVNNVTN